MSRVLETPVPEEVKSELGRSLGRTESRRGAFDVAGRVARARLDRRLSAINRADSVFQLQSEVLLERAGIHEAKSGAQTQEPPAAQLLAEHGAGVEQSKIGRIVGGQIWISAGRRLNVYVVEDVLRQRTYEEIPHRPYSDCRDLVTSVVETDGWLACHQITEQVAFGERKVVRIPERQLGMGQRSSDVDFDSDISSIRTLPRLTHGVNSGNVQYRIQISSADKQQRPVLHVEGRLHERVDEIQPVRSLVGAEISLQRQ